MANEQDETERRKQAARAKRIQGQENRTKAVEYRKMGMTYEAIAQQLGITKPSAHAAVKRAMRDAKKRQDEDGEIVMAMELENLDRLQLAAWPGAIKGNHLLIDRVLKIQERRAKLLGLDAPEKRALTDASGEHAYDPFNMDPEERQARIRELEHKLYGRSGNADE